MNRYPNGISAGLSILHMIMILHTIFVSPTLFHQGDNGKCVCWQTHNSQIVDCSETTIHKNPFSSQTQIPSNIVEVPSKGFMHIGSETRTRHRFTLFFSPDFSYLGIPTSNDRLLKITKYAPVSPFLRVVCISQTVVLKYCS